VTPETAKGNEGAEASIGNADADAMLEVLLQKERQNPAVITLILRGTHVRPANLRGLPYGVSLRLGVTNSRSLSRTVSTRFVL
jgi:hypothetical protein